MEWVGEGKQKKVLSYGLSEGNSYEQQRQSELEQQAHFQGNFRSTYPNKSRTLPYLMNYFNKQQVRHFVTQFQNLSLITLYNSLNQIRKYYGFYQKNIIPFINPFILHKHNTQQPSILIQLLAFNNFLIMFLKSQQFDIIQLQNIITMNEEAQKEEKQRYLREKILEKSYDAEEFMDFCESYRGNVDIDSWTISQLQEIVQKFIQSSSKTLQISPFQYSHPKKQNTGDILEFDWDNAFQNPIIPQNKALNLNLIDLDFLEGTVSPPKKSEQQSKYQVYQPPKAKEGEIKRMKSNPQDIVSKLQDQNNNFISAYNSERINSQKESKKEGISPTYKSREVIQSEKHVVAKLEPIGNEFYVPALVGQDFIAKIKCKSFANKPKLTGNYDIVVSDHEIINPNAFVPNFVLYTITVNPLNIEVKRRMKDFQLLKTILKKIFPSTQIPHLERYGRLSETEPTVIKKQKLFVQSFLNSLMMNKNLRCKIIDDFLLCQNLDQMKKNFREYQKLQKPKGIEDLYTTEGDLDLKMNSQNRKYLNQQALYLQYLQPNLIKLKQLYDQLLQSIANNVKLIQEISEIYDNLKDSTKNVNNLFSQTYKSTFFENSFEKISEMHKHWALSLKTQSKVLEVEIRHFYRFEFDNIQTMKDLMKNTESIAETYDKRSDREAQSKESYEYNKKLNDFKSGVQSPSKNLIVLKHQNAYFQEQTVRQFKRYLQQLSDKALKKFKLFSILQQNIGNELDAAWKDFQKFAS